MSKHTPGPWDSGHFIDDGIKCNCQSITCEAYMEAICTIHFDNGRTISDGGNDCPPLEEAKANSRLITAAPEYYQGAAEFLEYEKSMEDGDDIAAMQHYAAMKALLTAAHAKAEGR